MKRYGLIFRELLAGEGTLFQWPGIFAALRLMELSGEVLSGHFFEGITGIQFISPEAFLFLNEPLPQDAVFWMNATDPASLCGIRLEALKGRFPSRIPSIHLVFQGEKRMAVSRRGNNSLELFIPPTDPRLFDCLAFYKTLLTREFSPEKGICLETINGKPALASEYAEPLKAFGFVSYYNGLELRRSF